MSIYDHRTSKDVSQFQSVHDNQIALLEAVNISKQYNILKLIVEKHKNRNIELYELRGYRPNYSSLVVFVSKAFKNRLVLCMYEFRKDKIKTVCRLFVVVVLYLFLLFDLFVCFSWFVVGFFFVLTLTENKKEMLYSKNFRHVIMHFAVRADKLNCSGRMLK